MFLFPHLSLLREVLSGKVLTAVCLSLFCPPSLPRKKVLFCFGLSFLVAFLLFSSGGPKGNRPRRKKQKRNEAKVIIAEKKGFLLRSIVFSLWDFFGDQKRFAESIYREKIPAHVPPVPNDVFFPRRRRRKREKRRKKGKNTVKKGGERRNMKPPPPPISRVAAEKKRPEVITDGFLGLLLPPPPIAQGAALMGGSTLRPTPPTPLLPNV